MTEQQFNERLEFIDREANRLRERADAYRDQEMARLFVECGWTQERIAEKVGKSKMSVSRRLVFGRFLDFVTHGLQTQKPPENLTERRFRALYGTACKALKTSRARKGKTAEAQERTLFAEVLAMLADGRADDLAKAGSGQQRPGLIKAVGEILADGKPHTARQVRKALEERFGPMSSNNANSAMHHFKKTMPKDAVLETNNLGTQNQYRLRKRIKVQPDTILEIADKVLPIIEELEGWGRRHEYEQSPVAMRRIAAQLKKLFAPLLEGAHA